ncbi:MAG TPA: flagellar protein FlbB [Xanthobacteraceae bacterium]|nr:flagellar protein FlbB [Xanthobacteraceae bacterium]
MIGLIRELRLIPIVLIATACLLALKTADFLLDRAPFSENVTPNEVTSVRRAAPDDDGSVGSPLSWARQMFNFPSGAGTSTADNGNGDITGAVPEGGSKDGAAKDGAAKDGEGKPAAAEPGKDAKDPKNPPPEPSGTVIQLQGPGQPSPSERAILERLQQRRQELDTRARELDIRESLIKSAEKRMEGQLAELKEVEARIASETQQKEAAEDARFKGLVTMYENMKARDAAKIFDRLDIGILLKVASQINPRRMSDIMAQMSPEMAQRLTVEMASKAEQPNTGNPAELPKIEGKPTTP